MQRNDPHGLVGRLRERLTTRPSVRFDGVEQTIVHVNGPLSVRHVAVSTVRRVEAGNRDDASYDTVFLFFHLDDGDVLVVAETDKGFAMLILDLRERFPGVERWQDAVPSVPYQLTSIDLWHRP
ncbi:hypothetical protein KR767_04805 [Luteibacter anthropi]|uniref:hypothetical protein n=1 Tax=Luteibacter anthropi TaxID=564369 RepID=UPI002032AF4D|nr:hypothetical protein [Luteibacter anthropi]URX63393.1 hypothetical protein KR767_04805 [Luteibacter anthropi]